MLLIAYNNKYVARLAILSLVEYLLSTGLFTLIFSTSDDSKLLASPQLTTTTGTRWDQQPMKLSPQDPVDKDLKLQGDWWF